MFILAEAPQTPKKALSEEARAAEQVAGQISSRERVHVPDQPGAVRHSTNTSQQIEKLL